MRLLNDPRPWWGTLRGRPLSLAELIEAGTISPTATAVLAWAIERGASMFVAAGPPGAGKSTLATALLALLPAEAAVYVTAGACDPLAAPSADGPLYLLVNELSYHMPVYLSGPAARRAFGLLASGARMVGTLHARSTAEAVRVMCREADVERSALASAFLIAVISAGWGERGILRRVTELGFVAPGGQATTVASLPAAGRLELDRSSAPLEIVPAGVAALAAWAGLPLPSLEAEIAAHARQFAPAAPPSISS